MTTENFVLPDEQFTSFRGLPWFDSIRSYLTIGGAGGIGSYLTFFLARAGFRTFLVDFDTVEKRNLSGQFYSSEEIGAKKVSAVYRNVKKFSPGSYIVTSDSRVVHDTVLEGFYFFSAFDNMKARKDLFNIWKRNLENNPVLPSGTVPIFIDGRLEAEQLQIFCVTRERIEEYEKYLFDDSEVEDIACTMKQTSHVAGMIATLMTSFFTNHVTNIVEKAYVRDVPFMFEIFIPLTLISRK